MQNEQEEHIVQRILSGDGVHVDDLDRSSAKNPMGENEETATVRHTTTEKEEEVRRTEGRRNGGRTGLQETEAEERADDGEEEGDGDEEEGEEGDEDEDEDEDE